MRASPVGSSGTASTAFPPPRGTSQTANLRVIALLSSSASASASSGLAYERMRVPPPVGPRRVECTPMNIQVSSSAS